MMLKFKSRSIPMMFIVGTGSKHDNFELRHALRSVATYGRGISRMIVVETLAEPGGKSSIGWLGPNVEHVMRDPFVALAGRNRNITLSVVEGVERTGLAGDFILGIDDVFLTRKTDFPTLPTLAAAQHLPTKNPTGGSWGEAMVDTGSWLRRHGYPDVNFMTHAHIRMNADVIRRHRDELVATATTNETVRGLEVLSLVGNMSLRDCVLTPGGPGNMATPNHVAIRSDFKIEKFDLTGVTDCFSISDRIFEDPKFEKYMSGVYPLPSPWEVAP